MIFESVNGVRPIRLCERTRKFAYESLHHRYGKQTATIPAVPVDDIENFGDMDMLDKYDIAITRIAAQAPIRICENERISGAATLGLAISHLVPCVYYNAPVCESVSHLTMDFETVLRRGINGIEQDLAESLSQCSNPDEIRFLQSCRNVTDAMRLWHGRYLNELKELPGYADNYRNLLHVPFEPARDFYEAVQSLWFTFAFVRLCGNWPGIGRIDYLLGNYLKNDLQSGRITTDEAREILAHFFIKGCEWIKGEECVSGDAQHYQNIVISGTDREGNDITNEVTYLVFDIIEELGISDFPTSVRINSRSDEDFLRRVAEVLKFGGGVLAFYNEDVVLKSLIEYGYPKDKAWRFANDGCWEIQIPGETYFAYIPFDALAILQRDTLKRYDEECEYDSAEELYLQFIKDLKKAVHSILDDRTNHIIDKSGQPTEWKRNKDMPCTVVSVFEKGCIQKRRSYFEGGPLYNVISPHIGGYPDVVNSLYAIKKVVFDDKILTFREFMTVLRNNWEENEELRRYMQSRYEYYGNDNAEVDEIGARLLSDFAGICNAYGSVCGYRFPAGVSTFGRQLEWSHGRLASPHGYRIGAVLAPNCSPTPATDRNGASAVIRSYCKADLTKQVTGAALDIKLLPTSVEGEDGTEAIIGLLRGFVALGGCFMQPDVADKEILKQAQLHPEDYSTLSVRVSGWNARFVTLNKDWQNMIIDGNK